MSSERLWVCAETVRLGLRDHLAANPWRLSAVTTWPRGVLQCLFFTLLGVASTASDRSFAFVGSVALVMTLPASVGVATVPMTDKAMGTYPRIRLGRLPAVILLALRAVPWLAEAMIMMVLSALAVGALTGQLALATRLLALSPVFLAMAVSNAMAGLAIAAVAVGRNVEMLLGNALTYLIIAAGGVVVPIGRLPWLDGIGALLPIRHGLLGVRAILAGQPWHGHLLMELAVAAFWAVLAVLGYRMLDRRASCHGVDAFG